MSDYVHEVVVRYKPTKEEWEKLESLMEEEYQNRSWGFDGDFVKEEYKKFFKQTWRQKSGYFETAPTCEKFLDFVLLRDDDDACGDYGNVRKLTSDEVMFALPMFRMLIPSIKNDDNMRLVDFCWYNCCEAPDYFDLPEDAKNDWSGKLHDTYTEFCS